MHQAIAIKKLRYHPDSVVGPVLRTLPEHFGNQAAILQYGQDALNQDYVTYVAVANRGYKVGFAMVVLNNPDTAELWVMGVMPRFQGRGIGSALIHSIEEEARMMGATQIMVKTIGPSEGDANFLKTFNFYRRRGYLMVIELDCIWKDCQCALLLKKL